MRFLKKFFYVTVEEGERQEDTDPEGTASEQEALNPFLVEFSEDELDASADTPSDAQNDASWDVQNIALDQAALDFVDDVVAHTDFTSPTQGFEDSEGKVDLNTVLQSGGIDREAEEKSGELTMEKVWMLIQEGVPKESLPAVIRVSGKTVEDIVQDALRKGTICDQFEERYRQENQALVQSFTEEITTIEQETDIEIQRIKEETEIKIRELEERRRNTLEELQAKKQEAVSKLNWDIEALDTYEAQCAEVVKALKKTAASEDK